jgi:hypothetical protein
MVWRLVLVLADQEWTRHAKRGRQGVTEMGIFRRRRSLTVDAFAAELSRTAATAGQKFCARVGDATGWPGEVEVLDAMTLGYWMVIKAVTSTIDEQRATQLLHASLGKDISGIAGIRGRLGLLDVLEAYATVPRNLSGVRYKLDLEGEINEWRFGKAMVMVVFSGRSEELLREPDVMGVFDNAELEVGHIAPVITATFFAFLSTLRAQIESVKLV